MAITVNATVDQIQLAYPGLSATDALTLLNLAVQDVAKSVDLTAETPYTFNTVASQRLYTLNDSVSKIYGVMYQQASDVIYPLSVIHHDELAQVYRTFRTDTATQPLRYYVEGESLGLHPAPTTSTSGGNPVFVVHAATLPAAFSAGQSFATHIDSAAVFVYEALRRYAEQFDRSRIDEWIALKDRALLDLKSTLASRVQPIAGYGSAVLSINRNTGPGGAN